MTVCVGPAPQRLSGAAERKKTIATDTRTDLARPSKPLISRETAAKAALDVIDEVGLDKLSLDRVAKKLRVQPPSLYHHFSDKAELMAEVARLILTDLPDLKPLERALKRVCPRLCELAATPPGPAYAPSGISGSTSRASWSSVSGQPR